MSKMKFSFSLLLTLILVGMFSVVAFAAAPNAPINLYTSYSEAKSITISWSKSSPTDVDTTHYNVTLDGVTTPSATTSITLEADPKVSHTITVTALNATNEESVASKTYTVQAATTATTHLPNANQTGTGDMNKARLVGGNHEKVHGSYQNNTNSCASCHQVHTGADTNLLFKNGTYDTCLSCHDGTMNLYNVESKSTTNNAGVFAGDTAGSGDSMHNADGLVAVSAAPGGDSTGGTSPSNWAGEFTCTSCHNPHGSDSDRLLVTDPMGWGTIAHNSATEQGKLGTLYNSINIIDGVANVPLEKIDTNADYILVRETYLAANAPFSTNTAKFAGVPDSSKIIMTYKWDIKNKKYSPDFALWNKTTKLNNKAITDTSYTSNANFVIVSKYGYAYSKPLVTPVVDPIADVDGTVRSFTSTNTNVSYGIGVEMLKTPAGVVGNTQVYTVDNRAYFDSAYTGKYIAGSGAQMSRFCSACHNDYLSAGHGQVTGVHKTAFRHITNADGYTCVRCHFAHGTAPEVMKDSKDRGVADLTKAGGKFDGNTAAALDYLKDQNPSSTLKRYTGMSVCFGCHGGSIVNDSITQGNLRTDGLKPGQGVDPSNN